MDFRNSFTQSFHNSIAGMHAYATPELKIECLED